MGIRVTNPFNFFSPNVCLGQLCVFNVAKVRNANIAWYHFALGQPAAFVSLGKESRLVSLKADLARRFCIC